MQNQETISRFDSSQGASSLLADLYAQPGYEAGYTRGANDMLAKMLEAADEFARLQPQPINQTLAVIFAFSRFLENRMASTTLVVHQTFFDGSGI